MEESTKFFQSPMETDRDDIGRKPEDLGNFLGTEFIDVAHREDGPGIRVELLQCISDHCGIEIGGHRFAVLIGRFEAILGKFLERFGLLLFCVIDDEVVGDFVEEPAHMPDLVSFGNVVPRPHERVLHDVLPRLAVVAAVRAVPEDRIGVGIVGLDKILLGGIRAAWH